ncbi:DUF6308 family protein [Actinoplanes sp. RD1]|uniref:DUF6308 family protein n=1 Tax=Actinoplanes sp. RD1 TaxID=3064538 RepID=UPI0027411331|nr:DUF6308 family protein [Actinoplanes sp. RD1]
MPTDLRAVLRAAPADLKTYFATYTGRHFEQLGGGGDRRETRDTITATDLVAVTMLSVSVPAAVAADLLEGQLGRDLSRHLTEIPADVSLGTPEAAGHVRPGSPADKAWQLLKTQDGVGWVTAGKLLARKRPKLIPVWDRVVRCQLALPGDVWRTLDTTLADPAVRTDLAALRDNAGLPPEVTLLRILDVALWMRHHKQHRDAACPGYATVSSSTTSP